MRCLANRVKHACVCACVCVCVRTGPVLVLTTKAVTQNESTKIG